MQAKTIDYSIFKTGDVRGRYPEQVTPQVLFAIGRAMSGLLRGLIVIGRDGRIGSPELEKAIIAGLRAGAAEQPGNKIRLLRLGRITTPMLYYIVRMLRAGGGAIITASHNPKTDNGVKVVGPGAYLFSTTELREAVRAQTALLKAGRPLPKAKQTRAQMLRAYVAFLKRRLKLRRSVHVVADCSNGVTAIVLKALRSSLGVKSRLRLSLINSTIDGAFPAHGPNPFLPGATEQLSREVVRRKADMGVVFDGDGDRVFFVDGSGKPLSGDEAAVFLARAHTGAVVGDLRLGWAMRKYLASNRRAMIDVRVGQRFIREAMREHDAHFGAELSGHYYFRELGGADSGIFAAHVAASVLSELKGSMAEALRELAPYDHSGEINFEIQESERKQALIEKITTKYKRQATQVSRLDGVKMEFGKPGELGAWWVSARTSNTEPVLRLIIEANTPALLQQRLAEITSIIKTF